MSFKGGLIIIGIVALGVLVTTGVEEIRFRSMNRALLTEVKTLGGGNERLQATNDGLSEEIKALKAQLEAADQNAQSLRAEARTLKEKNQDLQTKNDDLTKQIKSVKAQLEKKTQQYKGEVSRLEEERRSLEEKISRLEEVIDKARAVLAPQE